MIEIIGTFNTAKCFASTLEDGAREQIKAVCDTEAFASSKIRIMPDVHAGKGCTIGTTMTITDKIVPSMVGVDIGCGMYTVYLGNIDIDFEKVDEAAHFIPCGRNVWEGRQERFDLTQLRSYRYLKDSKRLERSLGTLGGGNHFIEVDVDENDGKYLVIHSGSRKDDPPLRCSNVNLSHSDKIDVYDQLCLNWDEFVDYVWSYSKARKPLK